MRTGVTAAAVSALGLGALAVREAAAIIRVRAVADEGGRGDHATTVGEGIGEPLHLVLLGDSAVDGYGLDAAAALPRQLAARLSIATGRRVRVRSLAVSGATSDDVARFQLPMLRAASDVDAVLVGVGVNDVLQRTSAEDLEDATARLGEGLFAATDDAAIAAVVCHDLSAAPGLGPVLRRVVGARCRAVARRQRRVLQDLGVPVVVADGPGDPSMYGPDGLHPGRTGIEIIADRAVETLVAPFELHGADVG